MPRYGDLLVLNQAPVACVQQARSIASDGAARANEPGAVPGADEARYVLY